MEALFYLDFVKCAHEGARRIRSAMVDLKLPAPDFHESGPAGTPLVKVVLRNNVRHRRVEYGLTPTWRRSSAKRS